MSTDDPSEPENLIAAAIDAAEEIRDPLDGLVEKTADRSRRALRARSAGAARRAEEGGPRRLRGAAGAAEEGRLPGDGARRGHRRGKRRHGRARPDAGRHPDRPRASRRAVPRAGRHRLRRSRHQRPPRNLADPRARAFAAGWRAASSRRRSGAPSSEALQSALNVIEAKAHFDAPERVVHVRVGGLDGRLYLDLGDETWRAVEIDATGWRVIDNPPVRFRRAAGMQPLPVPVPGGSIETLRSFLNVQSDADFVLVVAWALACLRNRGPYPVIVLSGEQGSAKSTFSAILRALLDPNTAPLRALPREDRDLFIAASNGHVLAFDNVSGLPAWISDTLCRLATGGGFAVRQLYTDQDEVLFDAARPVILNGIEDIVTRPDLADRAVFLTLEPIPEERRRPEAELWAAFEAERPRILGVLLDAVVEGLKRLPETRLEKLPRMADFALWATACETALWPAGTFWSAYCGNRDEAVEGVIDADPIAAAVRALMATRTEWTGTASDLLGALGRGSGRARRQVQDLAG